MQIVNKKIAIYQEILERLLSKRYRFGEKILVKEISESTGVSRQPIMTALNSLQERGFIHITAQVGCQVVDPAAEEIADFYEMFAHTEGLIASLAAERGTPAEVARLKEINDKIARIDKSSSDGADDYRMLNGEFHRLLHAMARSPMVSSRQLANFELSDFLIVQSCGFAVHLKDVAGEHDEIIAALETRNVEAARHASVTHLDSVAHDVVECLRARDQHELTESA